jgi:saccharopine dehydrogenase-like NADP-dependent oxidoreductase
MTWIIANWWPKSWLKNQGAIEFLSHVSYRMTAVTNLLTGTGVTVRAEVAGRKDGKPARFVSSVAHESAAVATGIGSGTIAELLLSGELNKPGVWPVERALPTDLFEKIMLTRGVKIQQQWL